MSHFIFSFFETLFTIHDLTMPYSSLFLASCIQTMVAGRLVAPAPDEDGLSGQIIMCVVLPMGLLVLSHQSLPLHGQSVLITG